MSITTLKSVDNLDTRREAWICMCKLPPIERTAFLYWMCDRLGTIGLNGSNVKITISNETGDAMESYLDMFAIISQYGLDASLALDELERRASTLSKPFGIYVPDE